MGETTLMYPGRLDILCLVVRIICLLLFEGCIGASVVQTTQAGLLSCFLRLQEGLGRATCFLGSWLADLRTGCLLASQGHRRVGQGSQLFPRNLRGLNCSR